MNVEYIKVGLVCISRAGHDRNQPYLVTGIVDDKYVLICDGKGRSLKAPKRKQKKHLKPTAFLVQELANKLLCGKPVYDYEIAEALKAYSGSFMGKEG